MGEKRVMVVKERRRDGWGSKAKREKCIGMVLGGGASK